MSKINSCSKGKRGEREAAALIRAHGFEARRGKQYKGGADSPDVVHDIPGVQVEVKFRERFNLYDAMDKVALETPYPNVPIVLHRKKKKPWLVTVDANNFLMLMKDFNGWPV